MPQADAAVAAKVLTVAFVKKVVINVALAAAASLTNKALAPKIKGPGPRLLDPVALNTIQADPLTERVIIYGRAALAGELVFAHVHSDKQWISRVISIADAGGARGYSLQGLLIDGEAATLDGSGNVTSPSKYSGKLQVRFYSGTESQTADATLISASGGRWTDAHRGRGVCYAIVTAQESDETAFPNGLPSILFDIRREGIYDPRKDSTRGGSGSHRLADPSTWEPSSNAALVAYQFARGEYMGGKRIGGLGLSEALIDLSWVVASANACDTQGWTLDGVLTTGQDPATVLESFALHMGGVIKTRRGKLAIIAGNAWSTALTLGEDDLVGGVKLTPFESWRDAHNQGRAAYRDPSQRYETLETALQTVPSWIAEDGQDFELQLSLPFARSWEQAQRLVKLELYRRRAPRTLECAWKLRAAQAAEGDLVRVVLPSYSIDETYMVDSASLDPMGFRPMRLRLFDSASLQWATGAGGEPPAFARIDRGSVTPPTPEGWTAAGVSEASGGASLPQIQVSGSPPGSVEAVVIEFRPDGGTDWRGLYDGPAAAAGVYRVTGLAAAADYEVSIRYRNGRRLSAGRLVLDATTPAVLIATDSRALDGVPAASIVADLESIGTDVLSISQAQLALAAAAANTRQYLAELGLVDGVQLGTRIAQLDTERANGDTALAQTISLIGAKTGDGTAFVLNGTTARVAANETLAQRFSALSAADSNNSSAISTEQSARLSGDNALSSSITALTATVSSNTAAIASEVTARANGDSALASSLTALTATVNSNTAAITTEQTVRASGDSANATAISSLTTTVNGNTASITTLQSSTSGLSVRYGVKLNVNGHVTGFVQNNDGTTGDFIIVANKFAVIDPNGGSPFVPFSYSGGVIRMTNVEVDTLTANSVTTPKLVANAATKISSVTEGGSLSVYGWWSDALSLGVTTDGGPISIRVNIYNNSAASADLRFVSNGNVISAVPNVSASQGLITFETTVVAGAGTFNIAAQMQGSGSIGVRTLVVTEFKR